MRRVLATVSICVAFAAVGCDSGEEDGEEMPMCPGDPELLSMELPDMIAAGAEFEASFEVRHFEFSMEGGHDHDDHDHDGHDAQHPDDDRFRAGETISAETGCTIGHVHLYVDDLETNPVAQIVDPSAMLTLPEDIEPGEHTWIARLHDAEHFIIEPQVVREQPFTVE